MTDYRIVCTEQKPESAPTSHAHITKVGTNHETARTKDTATGSRTLRQVVDGIESGSDTFHTVGTISGTKTGVHVTECTACGGKIIRTDPDSEVDNNLDALRTCEFK